MLATRSSSLARASLLVTLLAAWAWRLSGLTAQSLWRDEVDSLRFATRPLPQVLAAFTRPGENGPLFYLLLRPWLSMAGHSEVALRFPAAWLGLLSILLVAIWGKKLWGPWGGMLAALLMAVNPYHLWYSQEARMYTMIMVWVLLALWFWVQALEEGGLGRWGMWYLFISLSFYTHVLAVLLLPVLGLWLLLVPRWRQRWRAALGALAALILPYLPLIGWQWALLTHADFSTGHTFTPLGQLLRTLFVVQIQGILAAPAWFFALPIFLLLAAGLLPYDQDVWSGNKVPTGPLLLMGWLLPALLLYLITLITPLFTDRYLIWVLPALVLLLVWGALKVARQNHFLALTLILILAAGQLWQGWQQMTRPIKPELRAAAAWVKPQRQPQELTLFLMPYIQHTYRYYDAGEYPWAGAPYANRQPDAAQIPQKLATMTAGYSGVWLIQSEADFYDQQGLIRAWLDRHATLSDDLHLVRADVYHYIFPASSASE